MRLRSLNFSLASSFSSFSLATASPICFSKFLSGMSAATKALSSLTSSPSSESSLFAMRAQRIIFAALSNSPGRNTAPAFALSSISLTSSNSDIGLAEYLYFAIYASSVSRKLRSTSLYSHNGNMRDISSFARDETANLASRARISSNSKTFSNFSSIFLYHYCNFLLKFPCVHVSEYSRPVSICVFTASISRAVA